MKIQNIELSGLTFPLRKKREFGENYFKIKCPKCGNSALEFSCEMKKDSSELMLFCNLCNSFAKMKSHLRCDVKIDEIDSGKREINLPL